MAANQIIKCKLIKVEEGIVSKENKVRIAVCDDEIEYLNYFKQVLRNCLCTLGTMAEIDVFLQPLKLMESEAHYDIIFLDIEMHDMNGIRLAKELSRKRTKSKIIFVTNYEDYIQEAYKARPFRYLYKTDPATFLQEAVKEALKEDTGREGLMLDADGYFRYILLDKIAYIEALGDEILITLENQEKYIVRATLKDTYGMLKRRFVRCNRSVIINFRYICRVETEMVTLHDGTKIQISFRERKNVKEEYWQYIRESSFGGQSRRMN